MRTFFLSYCSDFLKSDRIIVLGAQISAFQVAVFSKNFSFSSKVFVVLSSHLKNISPVINFCKLWRFKNCQYVQFGTINLPIFFELLTRKQRFNP